MNECQLEILSECALYHSLITLLIMNCGNKYSCMHACKKKTQRVVSQQLHVCDPLVLIVDVHR